MIRGIAALGVAVGLVAPGHVEPQVSEAPAGARAVFSFLVEHGCEDSPTVAVAIQIPEGAFDIVPVAPAGWTGQVEPGTQPVVSFTGGPLPADVQESFGFELVTPNRPGETILFPTVQTCEEGEIAWIDPAEESEEPAPRVRLTANDQPILPTTTTTTAPTTTTTSTTIADDPTTADPEVGDDGDDGGIPTWLIGVAALAMAGGAALVASRRRADRA